MKKEDYLNLDTKDQAIAAIVAECIVKDQMLTAEVLHISYDELKKIRNGEEKAKVILQKSSKKNGVGRMLFKIAVIIAFVTTIVFSSLLVASATFRETFMSVIAGEKSNIYKNDYASNYDLDGYYVPSYIPSSYLENDPLITVDESNRENKYIIIAFSDEDLGILEYSYSPGSGSTFHALDNENSNTMEIQIADKIWKINTANEGEKTILLAVNDDNSSIRIEANLPQEELINIAKSIKVQGE